MSKEIPGNQRHLTLENRIYIEKGLDNGMTFKEISKYLCKDPTTISKEVKKHRLLTEHNSFNSPNQCAYRRDCNLMNVCKRALPCQKRCKSCVACNSHCYKFILETCATTQRAPFVCNACYKKAQCRMDKYFYKAVTANRQYKTILSSAREGINMSQQQLQLLDEMITPLIHQGQSLYHITGTHDDIPCSVRTLYNYIEMKVLSSSNIDLPRKVKYKPRKVSNPAVKDPSWLEGRTYQDFRSYLEAYPDTGVVEMDTVVGCEGSRKVLLTLFFRNTKIMLIYLLPDKSQNSVLKVFNHLEQMLTTYGFAEAFPVILTDRGTEFSNPILIETGINSVMRTSIYYCDPMASSQKAGIEKNHEYIRYICPKGSSFDGLEQKDVSLIMNHINNTARPSLNGLTPFQLASLLLKNDVINAFGLHPVKPENVVLKPYLIKK
jgi:IS30 family transposase